MVEIPTPFTNLQLSGPGGTGFLGDFGATLALETTLAFGAALGFTGSTFQGTGTCQGLGQGMAINKLRPMSTPKCLGLASLKDLCIQDLCLGFLSWEPPLLQLPLQFLQLGPLRCSTLTNKRHSVNSKHHLKLIQSCPLLSIVHVPFLVFNLQSEENPPSGCRTGWRRHRWWHSLFRWLHLPGTIGGLVPRLWNGKFHGNPARFQMTSSRCSDSTFGR